MLTEEFTRAGLRSIGRNLDDAQGLLAALRRRPELDERSKEMVGNMVYLLDALKDMRRQIVKQVSA